jgi:tetratricopeptide (TPR) repeat protein
LLPARAFDPALTNQSFSDIIQVVKAVLRGFLFFALSSGLDAAPPVEWLSIGSPDFEVITCAPEAQGRDLLKRFEQIRGFFQKASPLPLRDEFPVRIIAFETPEQFAGYAPQGRAIAYFTSSRQIDYIVMQDATPQSYQSAVHEYVHLLVRHSGIHLPVWLNEGWADVYSNLRPVRDGVAVGDILPERMEALESSRWLDFDTLTSATMNSALYNEAGRAGIFYAESWALTHMFFLSPEYSEKFPQFLAAMNHDIPAADACLSVWGKTWQQVSEDLRNYFRRRKIVGRVFEVPLGKAEGKVPFRKVSDFDSRLTLANLNAAIGRFPAARQEYTALEKLQPENPNLNQALGYLALEVDDKAAARQYLEKAFFEGDADPQMCFELAMLDRGAAQPPEKGIAALERALKGKPGFTDALIQMGILRISARQYDKALEALTSIPKISPQRAAEVFWAIAYAYFETGDLEKARANALTAKRWSKDAKLTAGLDELLAMTDARSKSPYAPRPGEKTERVEGVLKGVDCSSGRPVLVLAEGERTLAFILPDGKSVEFVHDGALTLQFNCGALPPLRMTLDYAPGSVVKEGSAGVIRRMQF